MDDHTNEHVALYLRGATRPVTNKYLIRVLGLSISEGEMRAIIHDLRRELPILADNRGYWIARDVKDIMDYCGRLKHRIKEQEETLRNLSRHVLRTQPTLAV